MVSLLHMNLCKIITLSLECGAQNTGCISHPLHVLKFFTVQLQILYQLVDNLQPKYMPITAANGYILCNKSVA